MLYKYGGCTTYTKIYKLYKSRKCYINTVGTRRGQNLYLTFTLQEFTENVKFHIFQFLQIYKKNKNSYYITPTTVY